jgi:hypothetical protein
VFAELEAGPAGARAVFDGDAILIRSWSTGREHVHASGPGIDAGERDRLRRLLDDAFAAMEGRALRRRSGRMDDDTRRALRALGYTGGDGGR